MAERQQWGSKIGFILAASGSAIGLGNIVFFSANAYKFGAGAFYIPYLIALALVGIPVMILEFGLGHQTRKAFPQSMKEAAGGVGEFCGWWTILNACFIAMYYITVLGWVVGMWIGAFGDLWQESMAVPAFDIPAGALSTPMAFFFGMITEWKTVAFVALIWVLNALIVSKGVRSIEAAVKLFVPLMWIFMLILIVRGLTLGHGYQGVLFLFTPDFNAMRDPEVWQGAFSQIFFTLSLGFGIMTAYASYLPKDSDQVNNALMTSCLNCSFEYIAGVAIFSFLFVFAVVPKASTLGMMFFVIPEGIASLPAATKMFGVLFFTLLLLAGLSSTISLVETFVSALADKFGTSRGVLIVIVTVCGTLGSALFALPIIIDEGGLKESGTLGLTLLDLIDHWAFKYGLLIAGLVECILVAWVFGARRLVESINESSKFHLGKRFIFFLRFILPLILAAVIASSLWGELQGSLYGKSYIEGYKDWWWLRWLHVTAFVAWILGTIVGGLLLTVSRGKEGADA